MAEDDFTFGVIWFSYVLNFAYCVLGGGAGRWIFWNSNGRPRG